MISENAFWIPKAMLQKNTREENLPINQRIVWAQKGQGYREIKRAYDVKYS